jgi:hypothetical protein
MAIAAVAAGAVRIGAMVGKTAIGVTKVAGSTIRSGARVGSRATAKGAKKVNAGLKKAILQRKRVQRTTFLKNQRRKRRDVELQKRNAKEQELERRSVSKGGRGIKVPTVARNPLQALIEFLSTILIGWLINKLPQIIEWAEKLISFVKKTVKIIGSFFSNLKDALSSVVDLFKNTSEAIKNFDFADKDKKIRDSFDKLKESFKKMGKDIEDGKKLLKETTQKSPQEIMSQERSELMSDPDEVKSQIERVQTDETPTIQPQTPIIPTSNPNVGISEMDLFKRLVLAESGGEGILGMALVARSVMNRAGLIQSGQASTGTFLARDPSITGVIMGRGQYQPISDGSINTPRSQGQLEQAQQAINIASNPADLRGRLEATGKSSDEINKLMASTGFRTGSAFNDPSQNVNVTQFKNHYFNTAGNPNIAVSRATISDMNRTLIPLPRAETNLTMNTTSEDIIVIDDQPVPVASTTVRGSSSVIFVPVGPSLNSILKQQLLLDLAYT